MCARVCADSIRFKRITVYVDLTSEEELLHTIAECATRLAPDCVIIKQKDIDAVGGRSAVDTSREPQKDELAPSRTATTVGLIHLWQAEEEDVYTRDVNNTVLFMDAAEFLITDKNAGDGAVTYALYRRQMPILSFASTHLPARSSLQQLLYIGATAKTVEERKDAIRQFLTFPNQRGVFTVASAATADAGAVKVVVNADGYPVQLPCPSRGAHDKSDSVARLPPPPTLFASLLLELKSSNSERFDSLRRRNPMLPGVLEALHRYQNRGVMRSMLHRGHRVEVASGAAAAGLKLVEGFMALTESNEKFRAKRMAAVESTLANFESHWLELPLAKRMLDADGMAMARQALGRDIGVLQTLQQAVIE
ncbi:hypothetical protein ABL78_3382 [Leptomonas seymouri]|uniref:Uncharacterized protein n=1 Tax=Leptomonas seymouri TaxID=5684 RepID=A0A0N0P6E7_LEPSE|nr:hypothetical protein ABL78_3382 [Leptomonas seymouri]|eukprot:KPI87539.1 hypothetical protein ABL78_3382 [Leptomonas seymouri]